MLPDAGLQPSLSNVGLPDRQDPQPAEQMEEQAATTGLAPTPVADARGGGSLPEAAETDRDPRCDPSPDAKIHRELI